MFTRKRKKGSKLKGDPEMLYSNVDIYYNSYLTEALDAYSLRCLHFILRTSNNTKQKLKITYAEIQRGAELSCHNYVQKALKRLVELDLIEVKVVKQVQTVQLLKTAKKLKR